MVLLYVFSFIIFTYFQSKSFLNLLKIYPNTTPKQQSHYLSLLNAFITSISGIYLNFDFFHSSSISDSRQIIQILTISYFISYLVCDMTLGFVFYKKEIQILTGYIHHSLYIFISIYSIFSDNTLLYCLYFVSEIPTFLLSIGTINSKFRTNKIFGFLFFLTRIVYHSFLMSIYFLPDIFPMAKFLNTERQYTLTILSLSILGLHCFWFYKWYTKYF